MIEKPLQWAVLKAKCRVSYFLEMTLSINYFWMYMHKYVTPVRSNLVPTVSFLLGTRLNKKEFLSEAPVIQPQNFHIEEPL